MPRHLQVTTSDARIGRTSHSEEHRCANPKCHTSWRWAEFSRPPWQWPPQPPSALAASGRANPSSATAPAALVAARAKPSPPPPSGSTTFIKGYVDSQSTNNDAFGFDTSPTSDGGYIATGGIGLQPNNGWIGKLSSTGTVQWQEQLGDGDATFLSARQTSDGRYILAGG